MINTSLVEDFSSVCHYGKVCSPIATKTQDQEKNALVFLAPPGVFLVPPCKLVDITRRGELSNVDTWGGHCLGSKCFLMVSVKADRAMYKHISMGSYVYLEPLKSAASHKIYCLLCNFTLTMKTLLKTYYAFVFASYL